MKKPPHYPELLADLAAHLTEMLTDAGVAGAGPIAARCAEHIRKKWGGMMVYIAKGREYEISQRDAEIYRRFTGRNHAVLCRDYDISLQHLYRILKACAAADRRQISLFDES